MNISLTIDTEDVVRVGDYVRIQCDVDEATSLWWTKDEFNISASDSSNSSIGLYLDGVTFNDTGNYSCHAVGDEDKSRVSKSVVLTVESKEVLCL